MPKVAMLVTMEWSPLEGAVQCVRDIPTVGEEVNAASCGLNCLKDCCDLPSLGGLPGSQNGPVGPVSIEEDEPPSCTGPAASGAASPSVATNVTLWLSSACGSQWM